MIIVNILSILEPTLTTFLRLLQAYLMHGKLSSTVGLDNLYPLDLTFELEFVTVVCAADGSILYEITDYLEKNEHILTFKEKHDRKSAR